MNAIPPDHPIGPFSPTETFDMAKRHQLTQIIRDAPRALRDAVDGLRENQLDTRYKNWTIRQIAHHIADSHVHSYIRFKWALTEPTPTIKAYEEADWVLLEDCRVGAVEPALAMLEGLHAKWAQVLESMTPEQFSRAFVHPQSGETVDLWNCLNYYPWHAQHHTGQILWLRQQHGW